MSLGVREYRNLVNLLERHPEWREELRRLLLHDDLLRVPRMMEALVESQQRTDEQLRLLAQRVDSLAEVQQQLTQRVDALAEAQRRTDEQLQLLTQRVDALAEAQRRTELHIQRLSDKVAKLDGRMLEFEYSRKAYAYFGHLMRRVRVIDWNALEERLESHLTPEQIREILRLDLIVHGLLRSGPKQGEEAYLAVEISAVVDKNDVERAAQRAGLMRQAGLLCLPVVAGESITEDGRLALPVEGVIGLTDGKMCFVEEILQRL